MSRNVLVVEDESIVALELEEQLKRFGCHVLGPASTAATALELCEAEPPDLALMDIRIEGHQDGIEFAGVLRKRFDVPVIYLTALADETTMERAKLTSPASYLLKPVRDEELKAAIEIALHKRNIERLVEQQRAEFFAMLSHDIRSPLQSASGFAELLARELEGTPQTRVQELLSRMRDSLTYTMKLVSEYLSVLSFDSGGKDSPGHRLAANEMVRRVRHRYEAEASEHDLCLDLRLAENLPEVEADQLLLERSIDNLLFNALKFTPPGGRVTLSTTVRADEVVIAVADTGPGIPENELQMIFEIGWRRPVHSEKAGSGLGLHIVKTLVKAVGGRIEVESEVGRGTCFSIFLPVASADRPRSDIGKTNL